jgi:hypothetical protein
LHAWIRAREFIGFLFGFVGSFKLPRQYGAPTGACIEALKNESECHIEIQRNALNEIWTTLLVRKRDAAKNSQGLMQIVFVIFLKRCRFIAICIF